MAFKPSIAAASPANPGVQAINRQSLAGAIEPVDNSRGKLIKNSVGHALYKLDW